MISKFINLDEEKQKRILNAAIKEFADKGYDQASTNIIVKDASISKGLLFHYFTSKKQLYFYVFDYCVDLSINEMYEKINFDEKDVFLRLRQIMAMKINLVSKFPEIINFLKGAIMDNANDVKQYVADKTKELSESGYMKLFENIDVSMFKEGVDIEKAMNIIMWTFDGFSQVEIEKMKHSVSKTDDYTRIFSDADCYIKLLQDSFYKS